MTLEDKQFIINLAKEMKTQDTRWTAQPYGLVIGETKRIIKDYDNCDNKAIYWNETDYDTFEEFLVAVKEYYLEDCESHKAVLDFINKWCNDIDDIRNYECELYNLMDEPPHAYGYNVEQVFNDNGHGINFFLTEKEAKKHIERNKHNLSGPFTYGIHLFRNPEMEKLYDVIFKLGISYEEEIKLKEKN